MNNYEDCPPQADAMVHSMRAFGYETGSALADLIDNSIFAQSSCVKIRYDWNDGDPWVAIIDNGKGMSENELFDAMRPVSRSPLEKRDPSDLGRFGLGLKTASWSQCKYMVVASKKRRRTTVRFWDLDHVDETQKWSLGKKPEKKYIKLLEPLKNQASGTVVIWGNLDRLVDANETALHNPKMSFLDKFTQIKDYLSMVFHLYLEEEKLEIYVGDASCKPWDPYMKKNPYTQRLYKDKYEDSRVHVVPFILPHVSHRSIKEKTEGGGIRGWNAQQGFYVYRNKRMIVSGGWLGLESLKVKDEYKLARIQIDITNDMDNDWELDVKKAEASPPDRLRPELARIAKVARDRAVAIYKARVNATGQVGRNVPKKEIWIRERRGDKIIYQINKSHPILSKLLEQIGAKEKTIKNLFYLIENTVPHREIIIDVRENEDCHVDLPETISPPPSELLKLCTQFYKKEINRKRPHDEAVDLICSIEPFNCHPSYRAKLDEFENK